MPPDGESNQPKDEDSKRAIVEVEPDAKAKVIAYSKRMKLPMKSIVSTLIDLCVEHDLLKEGWAERLNMAMEVGEAQLQKNEWADLDPEIEKCLKMKWANKGWNCVEGTEGKLIKFKPMSNDLHEAMDLCDGCGISIADKKKVKQLDALIKNGIIVDLPSCIQGGPTQGDGKKIKIYCKHSNMPAQYRSVEKWCKVMKNGANCDSLRWTRHSIKGKLPEPKK